MQTRKAAKGIEGIELNIKYQTYVYIYKCMICIYRVNLIKPIIIIIIISLI